MSWLYIVFSTTTIYYRVNSPEGLCSKQFLLVAFIWTRSIQLPSEHCYSIMAGSILSRKTKSLHSNWSLWRCLEFRKILPNIISGFHFSGQVYCAATIHKHTLSEFRKWWNSENLSYSSSIKIIIGILKYPQHTVPSWDFDAVQVATAVSINSNSRSFRVSSIFAGNLFVLL